MPCSGYGGAAPTSPRSWDIPTFAEPSTQITVCPNPAAVFLAHESNFAKQRHTLNTIRQNLAKSPRPRATIPEKIGKYAIINEVGRGIAVACVATIYGVGIANLFFLPFAGKMRLRIHNGHRRREMMLEGVISILEGMNPRMLQIKLAGFLDSGNQEPRERAA